MRTKRMNRRTGIIVGAASALVLAGTIAPLAVANATTTSGTVAAAGASVPVGGVVGSGSPQSTVGRVADFYGAYIDAVSGDTGRLADDLRAAYLTPALRKRLAAWEAKEHADGVLRAQDVPVSWSVTNDGAGAGHAFTTVTLVWGGGPHPEVTKLAVQSDLSTMLISDIKPA